MVDDGLSSILGWISIACWIVVYSPQIYENFSLQSGEGLSVLFVVVWLIGDLFNLVGAVLGRLLPTVILLALYYTLCDLILLGQIYYYRWKRRRSVGERQPLLKDDEQLPREPLSISLLLYYTIALCFVSAVGVIAWWISLSSEESTTPPEVESGWLVQFFGWSSAALYLGARIPQIYKNFKTRGEGLSPALFFFAIFGNLTYALSICAKSVEWNYLLANAGWLAGSALTVFLDAFVLCQVFYYRSADKSENRSAAED